MKFLCRQTISRGVKKMERYDIIKLMEEMTNAIRENVGISINNNPSLFSEMVIHLDLFDVWVKQTEELNANIVLKEVCYDLISSLFISANGMYRNAYISLRSALELGLSFFYFLDNNFDFLLWKKNAYDMKWATLKNQDIGIVSKKYLSLFSHDLDLQELIEATEETYRECSEYVHGKYDYMHTKINEQKIFYDKENFEQYANMFFKVSKILNSFLAIRFNEKVETFEQEKLVLIKEILNEFKLKGAISA